MNWNRRKSRRIRADLRARRRQLRFTRELVSIDWAKEGGVGPTPTHPRRVDAVRSVFAMTRRFLPLSTIRWTIRCAWRIKARTADVSRPAR